MKQGKRVLFYVLALCLFMVSGLSGLLAVGGLCGVICGPEVFENGPPDRTQPYFWVMMFLMTPAMFLGFVGGVFVVIVPLAALLKIPVIDRSDWKSITRLYRFLKRARGEIVKKAEQKPERKKARIAVLRSRRQSPTRWLLRGGAVIASVAAMLPYWWCGATHVCMAGHMQHPPYPIWHMSNDILWVSLLGIAATVGLFSDFRGKVVLLGLAAALAFSRLGLDSGGGILFPLEILVASALILLAALNVVHSEAIEFSSSDASEVSRWVRIRRNAYVGLFFMPKLALGVVLWACCVLAYFLPAMLYQQAVTNDDPRTILRLASWGLDVDWRDASRLTPLHHAAMLRKAEICRVLIAAGADVNATDRFSDTPLHWAGSAEVAQVLVENGADVDAENEIRSTPLHDARSAEIAEVLIAAGANVNAKNQFCRTPLNTADDAEMRRLLIMAGSEAANSDQFGWTPMHDAAKWNNPEIIELLLTRCAPVDPRDGTQSTPLHYAASRGHTEVVRLLVARGADSEATNAQGETPRVLAENEGKRDLVELLDELREQESQRNQWRLDVYTGVNPLNNV